MTDLEKVKLAVEKCLRYNDCSHCADCPYNVRDDYGCRTRLRDDIIKLLKAHGRTARMMSLEEVKTLEAGKLVWIEISGGYEGTRYKAVPAIISQIFNGAVYFYNTVGRTLHSYNRGVLGWRLWTEEPSDTQRMAVKWE